MKRIYSKFRIALITFALGLASANFANWWIDYKSEIYVNLPQAESSSVFEIVTKRNWNGFEFFGHGCGGTNKYGGENSVSAYQTNSFRAVSISNSSHNNVYQAKKEVEFRIKDAVKVIEYSEISTKKIKIIQKRIILENESKEKKWVDIIKYDGGKNLSIISAPTLQLALEFEKWNKLQN